MKKKPWRFAHRGDAKSSPENTLDSIKAATYIGCDGIEVDVRLTKDNKVVLMHDEYISRMIYWGSNEYCDEKVRNLSWNELSKMKIPYENHLLPDFPNNGYPEEKKLFDQVNSRMYGKDKEFPYNNSGKYTHPVLLEEVILWLNNNAPQIFLEIECKDFGMFHHLEELIIRTQSSHKTILMSGIPEIIDEHNNCLKKSNSFKLIKLGANIKELSQEWLPKLNGLNLYEVGLDPVTATREAIDYLRSKGLLIFSNLGDSPLQWEKIHSIHFDALKTNYLREYNEWLKRFEKAVQ